MITIRKALELVYNFTEKQSQEFLTSHNLQDEHENPFIAIEQRIDFSNGHVYYDEYDWHFCLNCDYYCVQRLMFPSLVCSKCGGRLV